MPLTDEEWLKEIAESAAGGELEQLEDALYDVAGWIDCKVLCATRFGRPRDGFCLAQANKALPFSQFYNGDVKTMLAVIWGCLVVNYIHLDTADVRARRQQWLDERDGYYEYLKKFRQREPEFRAVGITLEIDPERRRVRYYNSAGCGPIYYGISREGFRRAMSSFYHARKKQETKLSKNSPD